MSIFGRIFGGWFGGWFGSIEQESETNSEPECVQFGLTRSESALMSLVATELVGLSTAQTERAEMLYLLTESTSLATLSIELASLEIENAWHAEDIDPDCRLWFSTDERATFEPFDGESATLTPVRIERAELILAQEIASINLAQGEKCLLTLQ